MFQQTLLMIKPEGIDLIDEIVDSIKNDGLQISEGHSIICSEEFLRCLYKEQSGMFWEVNKEYLVGKHCVLFIVYGDDAVSRLLALSGKHYSPENCDRYTIRYRFGKRETYIGKNGISLYLNAVHRSSPENAEYEVALFNKWFR